MHSNQPLAALSFNRTTLRVGVRDRYIGWDDRLKSKHLDRVVCNNRFLILPWVKAPNLASHILGQAIRRLPEDWFKLYGHRIFMVETFADARSNQLVFESMPELTIPVANKRYRPFEHQKLSFPPVKVSKYAEDENLPWQQISLAEGAKGLIVADVKIVHCVSCHSSTPRVNYLLPREEVWLYIRRYNDGYIKYSLCSAPADTPLPSANGSHGQAHSGLSPPSYRSCRAHQH